MGSLLAAVASYLDARAAGGQWLVRIEDIDPPREVAGASDQILRSLQAHGLQWDEDVVYQSSRGDAYDRALEALAQTGRLFRCRCTRAILGPGGSCGRRCAPTDDDATALRFQIDSSPHFNDRFMGPQPTANSPRDLVLRRKDGLYAYALAVAVDDLWQGITDVVRGRDLLHQTHAQIELMQVMGGQAPRYAHLPLICDTAGVKLSKQAGAQAIDDRKALQNLRIVLEALGQPMAEAACGTVQELLAWATRSWRDRALQKLADTQGVYPVSHES
ncbi:MAG: tRNA glutamyl-Q(34) synthetase GluQRS [Congregibacter sp.]